MSYLKLSLILLPAAFLLSNCTHTSTERNATLQVNFKHHQLAHNLSGCTLYIKYNTLDAPANGVYDDSATAKPGVIADSMQTAVITKLANGNYYIYGKGYDNSIYKNVKGGTSVTIAQQAVQTIDIPVSED